MTHFTPPLEQIRNFSDFLRKTDIMRTEDRKWRHTIIAALDIGDNYSVKWIDQEGKKKNLIGRFYGMHAEEGTLIFVNHHQEETSFKFEDINFEYTFTKLAETF